MFLGNMLGSIDAVTAFTITFNKASYVGSAVT